MIINSRASEFISFMQNKTKTQVFGQDLIEGQRIWAPGYVIGKGHVPVELIVVDSHVDSEYKRLKVAYVNKEDARTHAAGYDYQDKASYIYLGDLGVRPHNYDNRRPQVFFTREALEVAIELWAGQNPNFLYV